MSLPLLLGAIALYQGAAIAVGIGAVVAYAIAERIRKQEPELEGVFVIALSGAAMVLGIRIIYLCCSSDDLGPFHGDDVIYIVFGGGALIWVSGQQIRSLIWPKDE